MKAACCDVVPLQDSDLKQYWMPDSQCKECYDCNEKFTTFRRRHHCRLCGQIFCSRCCNQEIPGKFMGYTGRVQILLGYECIRKLFVIHQNILHCHFTSSYINVNLGGNIPLSKHSWHFCENNSSHFYYLSLFPSLRLFLSWSASLCCQETCGRVHTAVN